MNALGEYRVKAKNCFDMRVDEATPKQPSRAGSIYAALGATATTPSAGCSALKKPSQHIENHNCLKRGETNFSSCSLSRLQPVRVSLAIPTGTKDRRLAEEPDTQESNMKNLVAKFASDESGATAIEYGLIAALIAVAMIVGATSVGTAINAKFANVAARINAA